MGDYIVSGHGSSTEVENREHENSLYARRVVNIPSNQQAKLSYSSGAVEYVGFAPSGLATSSAGWLVFYLTYDSSGSLISKEIGSGAWDDRSTISYS